VSSLSARLLVVVVVLGLSLFPMALLLVEVQVEEAQMVEEVVLEECWKALKQYKLVLLIK
jgi:hypothetical protein